MNADNLERRAERLRQLTSAFYHEANIFRKTEAPIYHADRLAYIMAMTQAADCVEKAERLLRKAVRQYRRALDRAAGHQVEPEEE